MTHLWYISGGRSVPASHVALTNDIRGHHRQHLHPVAGGVRPDHQLPPLRHGQAQAGVDADHGCHYAHRSHLRHRRGTLRQGFENIRH